MNRYIRNSVRVLVDYGVILLIFVFFLYVFLSITGTHYYAWLPVYSFICFVLLAMMLYADYKKLAVREKRPQYNINPKPIDGLIYGLIGVIPIYILEAVYPFITLANPSLMRIKHVALNVILGPLYYIVRIGGGTVPVYILCVLVIPVLTMLGYMAGLHGFEIMSKIRKKPQKPPQKSNPGRR